MILTYKLRIRDKHAAELNRQARAVNVVWNYCNETQQKAVRDRRKWLSWIDLCRLTAGSSGDLGLHSGTIQQVCVHYDRSRKQNRKAWLRWRGHKSLGWVPFNTGHVRFDGETLKFRGLCYETMHLRNMPAGVKIGAGSFNADRRGRWYINISVEVETADRAPLARVGIDLGLRTLAAMSDGQKIEAPQFFRKSEEAIAVAQRAGKTKRARAINAKVTNRRKDFLHKLSHKLSTQYGLIVVGDVSSSKLSQTSMAKSVYDAGWSDLKRMLSYKSIRNGGGTLEVSERMTTQTCSECGSLPPSRPRGIAGLSNRMWRCDDCGTDHDRDHNAARNILRLGLETLIGGAPLWEQPRSRILSEQEWGL